MLDFSPQPATRGGIGGHHSAKMQRDEWLTPPHIIEALGPFDLDPCSPVNRPWPTAARHFTVDDNGLAKLWEGRVWLNPPYGTKAEHWMKRLVGHGNGIALLFARTETALFFPWVWEHASGLLFIKGRLNFHFVDGRRAETNSGAPSVLIAYGKGNAEALRASGLPGAMVTL